MNVLVIVAICVVLGAFGQIAMKKGMNSIGVVSIKELLSKKLLSVVFERYVFVGIVLYGIASLLWLVALSMEEVSYIYPLIGTGYILTAVFAWILLGEKVTAMRLLGVVLISLGAYFVVMRW